MARINFKTIAKNVDYTTFATYQEMLSYAGGSLSYPGQILGVLQAHDTPDNVTPFILDANKTPVGIASFTKVQEMIEDHIGTLADVLMLQGNAPSDEFTQALTNHTSGWTFVVTTSGTYVGQKCNVGDMIVCKKTGTAANNSDWFVVESNQPNMVTSDISEPLESEVPVFGATGKTISGSGISMKQVATILENQIQKGDGSFLSTAEVNGIKSQLGVTDLEEEIAKTIPILTATGQTYSSGDTTKKFTLTHTNGKAFNGYGLALVQFTGDMNYLSTIQQTILTFGSDSYTAFLNKVTTIQAIGHKNRSVLSAYSYFFVFFNTSTAQFLCECWEDDGELRLPSGASIALEGDITAPKSMQGVDLDTLTDIGVYYGVPQNKSGQPAASDFASLFVLRGSTNPDSGICQVYYADGSQAAWRVKPDPSNSWTDWKSVGVDKVTLWGQSFNGTNNVSGDMTGVGNISMTGSITNLTRLVTVAGDGGRRVKIDSGGLDLITSAKGAWVMGLNVRKQDLQERLAYIIGGYGTSAENIQYIFLGGTDYTSGLVTLMISSGNMGIGTTNPTEKLDVNGNALIREGLTVNGGITGTLDMTLSAVEQTPTGTSTTINYIATGRKNTDGLYLVSFDSVAHYSSSITNTTITVSGTTYALWLNRGYNPITLANSRFLTSKAYMPVYFKGSYAYVLSDCIRDEDNSRIIFDNGDTVEFTEG